MPTTRKVIRLVFPQWQGGVNPPYYFGAEMLAWLAPRNVDDASVFVVPVRRPEEVGQVKEEEGMMGRRDVLANHRNAVDILARERPDAVVVLGGDCGVSLAPFSYLSTHYKQEKFGILWIDSHPDITANTPGFPNSHMFVLANIMGKGDAELVSFAKDPVPSDRILYAGVHSVLPHEEEFMKKHNMACLGPAELKGNNGSQKVADWVKQQGITHLAIHLDLDVLNPETVKSIIYTKPDAKPGYMDGVARGTLELAEVAAILRAVEGVTSVVGLTIAEFFPWDAMNLKKAMEGFPLLNGAQSKL